MENLIQDLTTSAHRTTSVSFTEFTWVKNALTIFC